MSENQYVEMICHLADQPQTKIFLPKGFEAKPLKSASEDELYECYCAAFQAGDAAFFFEQSATERREYFETLELDQARENPASVLITRGDVVAGFTYVIPYGEGNRHISCMVVHPDYQRQGLGAFMVQYAKAKVADQGCRSITLDTDTKMGAFQLYRKYGFEIITDTQE